MTIGILGGMGPAATVELMSRIIRQTPAKDDRDHLRMLVDNNPKVPSRIEAIIEGTGADPLPELQRMAQGLEAAGADFLIMACNTAHHYHAESGGIRGDPVPEHCRGDGAPSRGAPAGKAHRLPGLAGGAPDRRL